MSRELIETITLTPSGQRLDVFFEACPEEDLPVRGNLSYSGDATEDRKAEDEVLARLDRGDIAAWFYARITVEARVSRSPAAFYLFTGTTGLGRCSYDSTDDFLKDVPQLKDLRDEAIYDLLSNVREEVQRAETGSKLLAVLEKLT